jgi:hypothetical protein
MSSTILFPYLVLAAAMLRALAVRAHLAAPSCARCGQPLERRALGDTICRCRR